MKRDKAIAAFVLTVALAVLLAILFWDFFAEAVIMPAARAAWIVLRLTILRVDQKITWALAILACFSVFLFKIDWTARQADAGPEKAVGYYLKRYELWKVHFLGKPHDPFNQGMLRPKVRELFVTLYAVRNRLELDFKTTEAFKGKKDRLPERIYSFLYPERGKRGLMMKVKSLADGLSGRDAQEYDQRLEEVISYLENHVENRDG